MRRAKKPVGRSENMRRIRSADTKPELILRRSLYAIGKRYRIHDGSLPGTPDIVFRRLRVAVFVHGCFWHQHSGCREASKPRSNGEYWQPKLARNVERDRRHEEELRALGYQVLVLWECDIERDPNAAAAEVISLLQKRR